MAEPWSPDWQCYDCDEWAAQHIADMKLVTRLRAELDALREALEKIDAFPIPAAAREILRAALRTKEGE